MLLKRVYVFLETGLGEFVAACESVHGNMTYILPNRPAAVCYANRSHALLLQGRYQDALYDAERAVKTCPEYLLAHKRCVEACINLDKFAEAKAIQKKIHAYEQLLQLLPWYGAALLATEWITHEEHQVLYLAVPILYPSKDLVRD